MAQQILHKFNIDDSLEINLTIPDGVFVPTDTTTTLVDAVKTYVKAPVKLLDLGAGSGVVGITLSLLGLVKPPLYGSDLSIDAVNSLIKNAGDHNVEVVGKSGSLFKPWRGDKFDCIVDDISGVAEEVAKASPWFNNVPCQSGIDGTDLIIKVLQQAPDYLMPGGVCFFPVLSLSNTKKILDMANRKFKHVKRLCRKEWPLPKEMYQHMDMLDRLKSEGHIQIINKFGMVLWYTDIYAASNDEDNK